MLSDNVFEKCVTLAFDERTPENEAMVAFNKIRSREYLAKLRNVETKKMQTVFHITNVPCAFFISTSDWAYNTAKKLNITGMTIKLLNSSNNSKSKYFANFYFQFDSSSSDRIFKDELDVRVAYIKHNTTESDLNPTKSTPLPQTPSYNFEYNFNKGYSKATVLPCKVARIKFHRYSMFLGDLYKVQKKGWFGIWYTKADSLSHKEAVEFCNKYNCGEIS